MGTEISSSSPSPLFLFCFFLGLMVDKPRFGNVYEEKLHFASSVYVSSYWAVSPYLLNDDSLFNVALRNAQPILLWLQNYYTYEAVLNWSIYSTCHQIACFKVTDGLHPSLPRGSTSIVLRCQRVTLRVLSCPYWPGLIRSFCKCVRFSMTLKHAIWRRIL